MEISPSLVWSVVSRGGKGNWVDHISHFKFKAKAGESHEENGRLLLLNNQMLILFREDQIILSPPSLYLSKKDESRVIFHLLSFLLSPLSPQ